ncbi:MarR family winged helix-turn-helix transcriptional regulator [Glutamicibacter soli]
MQWPVNKAPTELLGRLLDELARTSRLLRSFSHLDQTDPEVSNASHHVLKTLDMRQPTHAADLASHLGIGTAAMSRHLAELEQAGLVDKRPSDLDARRQVLWVTEAGSDRLEARAQLRIERLRPLLPDWDNDRMTLIADALGELNNSMIQGIHEHRELQAEEPRSGSDG